MKYVAVGHRVVGVRAEVDAENVDDALNEAHRLWNKEGWSVHGVALFCPTEPVSEDVRELSDVACSQCGSLLFESVVRCEGCGVYHTEQTDRRGSCNRNNTKGNKN